MHVKMEIIPLKVKQPSVEFKPQSCLTDDIYIQIMNNNVHVKIKCMLKKMLISEQQDTN